MLLSLSLVVVVLLAVVVVVVVGLLGPLIAPLALPRGAPKHHLEEILDFPEVRRNRDIKIDEQFPDHPNP